MVSFSVCFMCVCECVCVCVYVCISMCVYVSTCVWCVVCVRVRVYICNNCGPAVSVLHFSLIACDQGDKVLGSILAWSAVGTGGQVLPRPSVLRWAISRAFLCGVCMFSPLSQGVSSRSE